MKPSANPFQDKKVFITGATGFVGSHLTRELLAQGAEVTALINDFLPGSLFDQLGLLQQIKPVVGTLTDFEFLRRVLKDRGIDTVIHLAAVATEGIAFQQPLMAFEVNIRGTYNLLEACRELGTQIKRVIIASSDKAYGSADTLPYREDFPLAGRNPYDVSKSCADLLSQAYFHSYRLPVAVGRYGNIFGPGDLNFNRLIPGTLRRLHKGEAPLVKVHQDGPFTRDFLYIKDVVQSYVAMARGLENPINHGQAFNFALCGNWQVSDIVKALQKVTRTEHLKTDFVTAPHGEIQHQHVSNEKALVRLGWQPQFTMERALQETAAWYFRHFESKKIPATEKAHAVHLERIA